MVDPNHSNQLSFAPYDRDMKWVKNMFHVEQPDVHYDLAEPAEHMDLIIVPLVAIDAAGHRIGRGKGCYDRTLSFLNVKGKKPPPFLLGVCHACQVVSNLVPNPWDVQLHDVLPVRT